MVNTVSNIIGALSSNYGQKSIFSLVNNDDIDYKKSLGKF